MTGLVQNLRLLFRLFGPLLIVLLGVVVIAATGIGRWMAASGLGNWPAVLPFALLIAGAEPIMLLLIVLFGRFDTKYKALFADDHIIELAQRLAKAKAAAIALLEKPYEGQMRFRDDAAREQGNKFETSAHLELYYTIDHEAENFRHHISMSYTGGVLALSAGQHFAGYLNELLRVDLLNVAFMGQSDRLIFHISFVLSPSEQGQFAETAIPIPEPAELPAIRARAREMVTKMRRRAEAGRRRPARRCRVAKPMSASTG